MLNTNNNVLRGFYALGSISALVAIKNPPRSELGGKHIMKCQIRNLCREIISIANSTKSQQTNPIT